MTVDLENINTEAFNEKFKNYLRDFYIYQFKESDKDFKTAGSKKSGVVDKNISPATFYNDFKRLQNVLEKAAGIKWLNSESNKVSSRVECVTVNSRTTYKNPFFRLYRYCSENATLAGSDFALVYFLLLHFRVGGSVKRCDIPEPESYKTEELWQELYRNAILFEANKKRHAPKKWSELSDCDKQRYADKAIAFFMKDGGAHTDIYRYIVLNNKKPVFENGGFKIVNNTDGFIEKSRLYYAFADYIGSKDAVKERHFLNKLDELERIGILRSKKEGKEVSFALSELFMDDLLVNDTDLITRFTEMISFFAEVSLLGVIGDLIADRLPRHDRKNIYYKHSYLSRALNDYNNIDLLYAIKNGQWLWVEYRNASAGKMNYQSFVCYPLELRESVTDGRQYLIYYHPGFRSVSAARVEFIDGISIINYLPGEHFKEDIQRARKLIDCTFGASFDGFAEGNVKEPVQTKEAVIVIKYENDEQFIKSRIYRELRGCITEVDEKNDGYLKITAQTVSINELAAWLSSYITRVVSFTVDGQSYDGFTDSVYKTYLQYTLPMTEPNFFEKDGQDKAPLINMREEADGFAKKDNMHSLIFNDIYSTAFAKLGDILLTLIKDGQITEQKLKALEKQYTDIFNFETAAKRKAQFKKFTAAALQCGKLAPKCRFSLQSRDAADSIYKLIPLTAIELQWLENILKDPLAKCFLKEQELGRLQAALPKQSLFDINDVLLYDQFTDGKEETKKQSFGENMQKILSALRQSKKLGITYIPKSNKVFKAELCPAFAEYSKRDSRFRLIAVNDKGKTLTLNAERIVFAEITSQSFRPEAVKKTAFDAMRQKEASVDIIISDIKNSADRILTEFAPWQKRCVKYNGNMYRLTLVYDRADIKEIVIRLLRYGPYISIPDGDGELKGMITERLENQIRLFERANAQQHTLSDKQI